MSFVGDMFGGGDDSASASRAAAETQAGYQREALQYLKDTERIPQQYREGALGQLAGAYGVEGGTGSQQDLIDRARQSPLYTQMMSGQNAGEQAILRNASATGGLRSGNVQGALADYNTKLQNEALLQSYNQQMQGLGGLANQPSLAMPIAQGITGIGQTLAQGQLGSAQAQQVGGQQSMNNAFGVAGLAAQIYGMF